MSKTQQDIEHLARKLVKLAQKDKLSLCTAESCTGGGIGAAITGVPGASQVFMGGIIAYANSVKTSHLHVPDQMIERYGAVSEPVACAMAEGANNALGTDIAVSVTGIAGPNGGTADKPVGHVWIALAHKGRPTLAHCFNFQDLGRENIRLDATKQALKIVCQAFEA